MLVVLAAIFALVAVGVYLNQHSTGDVLLLHVTIVRHKKSRTYYASFGLLNLSRKPRAVHVHPHEVCQTEDLPDRLLPPFSYGEIRRVGISEIHSNPLTLVVGYNGERLATKIDQ